VAARAPATVPPSSYAVGEIPCSVAGSFALDAGELRADATARTPGVAGSFALDAGELRAEAAARTPGRRKLRLSEFHQGRSFRAAARSIGNVPTTLDLT
jgi:hypothetical protein